MTPGIVLVVIGSCASPTTSNSDASVQRGIFDAEVDGPPGTAPVIVKNYQSQCSVTVRNGVASTEPIQRIDVYNIVVPLSAVALPGFELGPTPWHDTDGDHGSGDPGTISGSGQSASSTATISLGSIGDAAPPAACVWVCCESAGGGCPTTDQCQ